MRILQHEIEWTQVQCGRFMIAVSAFYAIGLVSLGRIVEWLSRASYGLTIVVLSIAATLHAAGSSVMGFAIVRSLLGIGEGGNCPAATETTTKWLQRSKHCSHGQPRQHWRGALTGNHLGARGGLWLAFTFVMDSRRRMADRVVWMIRQPDGGLHEDELADEGDEIKAVDAASAK
ncbi:MFS transporter [Candidatus Burkholderia verschuerenii]|uniref:MFS transporter n=1 Tax=Candidatus Burkholderia verschuerenii TaxID=242163 RepID=UPI00067CE6A8|nr:MFS transporter [Candidatus Burkholderia verschuerenii]